MEFENLQAIWDTQNDKPVFAMQDARLLVALYQQRERSRQRAFRLHFAPMYVAALVMLAVIGSLIATFRNIDSLMRRFKGRFTHNGFAMSAWDYAGLAVAAGALLALVVPLYRERKKHERTQEIFAPSLREELDRGLAQLDFEIRLDRAPRILRILTLSVDRSRDDQLGVATRGAATRRHGGRRLGSCGCSYPVVWVGPSQDFKENFKRGNGG